MTYEQMVLEMEALRDKQQTSSPSNPKPKMDKLFKFFFYGVLPAVFVFFCITSYVKGNLSEDIAGYLIAFGLVEGLAHLLIRLNRNTQ